MEFNPKVSQLGYVALETPDIEKAREYYGKMLSMTEVAKGHDGEYFLSLGYDHHNLVLKPAKQKALTCVGFQLRPGIELATFARDVNKFGLKAAVKSDSAPGVSELVEVEGPGGHTFQFYSEIETPSPGFKDCGVHPLRLGHVAIICSDARKLISFYQDFLGFWFTDAIGEFMNFMTCNRDHHVVNIVGTPENRLHHMAFELRDNASHLAAFDVLSGGGWPVQWGPGRHGPGHNIASYHYGPDQTIIEMYTEMDVLLPDRGLFEPRPWHKTLPMKPHVWALEDTVNTWGPGFTFTSELAKA